MTEDLFPAAGPDFRQVWRGYDREQVDRHLAELENRLRAVEDERGRLASRIEELGGRTPADVREEFENVSRQVGEILRTAWEAAEEMRVGASAEATQWRTEAREQAEAARRQAQADAEALRRDAWNTAQELVEQVQEEVDRRRRVVERETLTLRADAEREAHRLVADAKREAEEQVRSARMEAERLLVEARSRHDEIVEAAHREAQNAQERARALEARRRELMDELETARATIQRLETDLEAKREALRITPEETAVRLVAAPEETREEWRDGDESVRIVPAPARARSSEPVDADAVAAEVRRLREARGPDDEEPEEAEEAAEEEPAEPTTLAEPPEEEREEETEQVDEVAALFAVLRGGAEAGPAQALPPKEEAPARPLPGPTSVILGELDPFELRERLLLPVQNRVLRSIKRQLTEQQNIILEELRVREGDWQPETASLEGRLHGDLVILSQESFAAGVSAAADLTGRSPGRPRPEGSDLPDHAPRFAADLMEQLGSAIEEVQGAGPRETSSVVSRVFRAWRTDEAERRVRSIALEAFHRGLVRALAGQGEGEVMWVVSGKGCPGCRAAGEAGPVTAGRPFTEEALYPPAHPGCSCILVPVGA